MTTIMVFHSLEDDEDDYDLLVLYRETKPTTEPNTHPDHRGRVDSELERPTAPCQPCPTELWGPIQYLPKYLSPQLAGKNTLASKQTQHLSTGLKENKAKANNNSTENKSKHLADRGCWVLMPLMVFLDVDIIFSYVLSHHNAILYLCQIVNPCWHCILQME